MNGAFEKHMPFYNMVKNFIFITVSNDYIVINQYNRKYNFKFDFVILIFIILAFDKKVVKFPI